MGCAANKSSRSNIITAPVMKSRTTVGSSGLNFQLLEKQKVSDFAGSLNSSPDTVGNLEPPKARILSEADSLKTKQTPKGLINEDFSFNNNFSFFPNPDGNVRKGERIPTGTFHRTSGAEIIEKKDIEGLINHQNTNSSHRNSMVVENKVREQEEGHSHPKNFVDLAGSTFSFNLRNSHYNQSTTPFCSGDINNVNPVIGQTNQFFTFNHSSAFGIKDIDAYKEKIMSLSESSVSSIPCSSPEKSTGEPGENVKLVNKTKEPLQVKGLASLSMIDHVEDTKDKFVVTPSQLASTNAGSRATITSLAQLCLDENKKATFTRKFTMNLVKMVKPSMSSFSELDPPQIRQTKSLQVMQSSSSGSVLRMKPNFKVSSVPNIDIRCNLLHLAKQEEEEDNDEEEKVIVKKEVMDDIKEENPNDNSIELSGLEMPEYEGEFSPVMGSSIPNFTKTNTPKTNVNSSFSRQVETSNFLDKTIINVEDNITRMDLDKYSINFEIAEKQAMNESNQLQVKMNKFHHSHRRLSNSLNQGTRTIHQIKSAANIPKINDPEMMETPKKAFANPAMRPQSFQEMDKDNKFNENQSPSTGSYLSPDRIPRKSQTGTPQNKILLQELNKTVTSVIETRRADKSVDDEGQKKINQYLLIKDIGNITVSRGGFGKVKLAIHCDTKEQYAIKIANKNRLKKKLFTKSKSAYTLLAKEVAIMKKMDHPNIVKLVEVIDDPSHNNLYLVMDYIKKGAVLSKNYLKDEIAKMQDLNLEDGSPLNNRRNKIPEEKAKRYFRHLTLALDYLHNTVGIIHRDIKPENLLIGADDVLKVSDFGISEMMDGENDILDTNAGTKFYLAPEAWQGKSFHGKPADIWAAGGTLYYLVTGRPPFQSFAADDLKRKILEDDNIDRLSFPSDSNLSSGIKRLIEGCLKKDPKERTTLKEIINDPWLTDNGRNPLEHNAREFMEPSEEDISKAITKISFMAIVYVTATLKKVRKAKENLKRKKTQGNEYKKIDSARRSRD